MSANLQKILYSMSKLATYGVIICCSASMVLANESTAQRKHLNEISIELDYRGEDLLGLIKEIENTSDFSFAYSKRELKGKWVSVAPGRWNMRDVLAEISVQGKLFLRRVNEVITIRELQSHEKTPEVIEEILVQRNISGQVTDEVGEPLPGASVLEKGTTNGTITNANGEFTLEVADDAVLVVSFVGYESREVPLTGESNLVISLQSDLKSLEEIVVIGYGTSKRKNITGAVSSIAAEDIEQVVPVNTFDALQGRLSGVQILSNGGPGEGQDIRIRGTSTFNGGVDPLYVVDGQQLENIDNLDPNSIESIEVLKDGASAAIYGSKSANGVVLITTKKGKSGKPELTVNYARSYADVYTGIPISNSAQRTKFENLRGGSENDRIVNNDSLSLRYQQNVNIQEEVFRLAVRDQVNLALGGGGEKGRFYWNNGFINEEGVVVNSDYMRFNTNLNIDFDFSDRISGGTRMLASFEEQNGLNENTVFDQISQRPAYLRTRDFDGSLFPETFGRQNPLAEALETERRNRNYRATIFNYLDFKILPSLTFTTRLGANFRLQKRNDFDPTIVQRPGRPATGRERQDMFYDWQQENFFNYARTFGDHNVSFLLGNQVQKWKVERSDLRAVSFSSDLIRTFNNVSELDGARTLTRNTEYALASFFARASYDFKSRYLFSATFRRDGSSRFGSANQWGNFPSVSAGWRISDEQFFQPLQSVISDMKFRGGFAITGNERIDDFDRLTLFQPGFFYQGSNGVRPNQLGNPDLKWEATEQFNVGVDIGFLDNRFQLTADYYIKTTEDLLLDVNIPEESGFSSVRQNIGSVENRGWELALSGTVLDIAGVQWFSSINISFNDNKVLKLADEDGFILNAEGRTPTTYKIEEGQPVGNFWGFKNLGVFAYDESNAYTDDGTQLTPVFDEAGATFIEYQLNGQTYTGNVNQLRSGSRVLGGGDIIWEDLNGDFVIDQINDRQVIGNGLADFYGGFFNEFRYKNFTFSFLFDYNFGNDIYRDYDYERNHDTSFGRTPHPDRINGAWVRQGDIAEWPSLQSSRAQNRIGNDSKYVDKGDWIKLRNVRLNYNLPESLIGRANWIDGLIVSFSVNNLATWTNYQGYNPEIGTRRGNPLQVGLDQLRYPNKTDYIFSLQARF